MSLPKAGSKPPVALLAHLLLVVSLLGKVVYHLLHLSVTLYLKIFDQGIKSSWSIVGLYYGLVGLHNAGNPYK